MKDRSRKISSLFIRIVFFLIFFSMFLIGVNHFVNQLPFQAQKPVIHLKRGAAVLWHRFRLGLEGWTSDEQKIESIKTLLAYDKPQVIPYCKRYRDSQSPRLQEQASQCLLSKASGALLQETVEFLFSSNLEPSRQYQYVAALHRNPNGTEGLKSLLASQKLSRSAQVAVKGHLLERGSGEEEWIQEWEAGLATLKPLGLRQQVLAQLTRHAPDSPTIENFYREQLRDKEGAHSLAIEYFVAHDRGFLHFSFLDLYHSLPFTSQLFLVTLVPRLCPPVELKVWSRLFTEADSYSLKKALLQAIRSYSFGNDFSAYETDLKLKEEQKESLRMLPRPSGPPRCD